MDNLSSLKAADLKRELKARNLSASGAKQVLVDRLLEAMSAEKASNDNDSNIDDLLDEDSMLGEEESDGGSDGDDPVVADLTISSPTAKVPPISLSPSKKAEPVKRPSDQNGTSAQEGAPPSKKKIILNRQPVPEAAPQVLPVATAESIAASKTALENKTAPSESGGDKAVIKISDVAGEAAADKLKLRQEKFGNSIESTVTVAKGTAGADVSDKLKKRAERFGVAASGVAASGKVTLTTEDDAKIAKRKERFGLPSEEKVDELKQKRAARFGLNAKSADSSSDVDDKKKLRAARFAAAL